MSDVSVQITGSPASVAEAMRRMHGAPLAPPTASDGPSGTEGMVVKSVPERRYVLGVAYQAGKDPNITMGLDGHRDFIAPDDLEVAAWSFMAKGATTGLLHSGFRQGLGVTGEDGTEGHALVVESYLYRGPDWIIKADADDEADVVVKAGDWLVGAILDDTAWGMWKRGEITGWSPQGLATRRTRSAP